MHHQGLPLDTHAPMKSLSYITWTKCIDIHDRPYHQRIRAKEKSEATLYFRASRKDLNIASAWSQLIDTSSSMQHACLRSCLALRFLRLSTKKTVSYFLPGFLLPSDNRMSLVYWLPSLWLLHTCIHEFCCTNIFLLISSRVCWLWDCGIVELWDDLGGGAGDSLGQGQGICREPASRSWGRSSRDCRSQGTLI